jgi:SAM-dependent methyltransferase
VIQTGVTDLKTAEAFSSSWINCFSASPYTLREVREWLAPVPLERLAGKKVCEMGCGNGGLLQHVAPFTTEIATGVELGRSIETARENFGTMGLTRCRFIQQDLVAFAAAHPGEFDFVYCIGVLHHMQDPGEGFRAVLRATRPGGRFHCWVYGYEGNLPIRTFLEPVRRMASRLPWRLNKYGLALPLAVPFFILSQSVKGLRDDLFRRWIPLYDYLQWIGNYPFAFHHHVAFDQLVSPQTAYLRKETIEQWLCRPDVADTYILSRNGNSWKFGGTKVS